MTGNLQGFVARFLEYVSKKYDNKQLTKLHLLSTKKHYRMSQSCRFKCHFEISELHCGHCIAWFYIFAPMLFINGNFGKLLQLSETSAEDILYLTAVRWLSQGKNISPCSAVAQRNSGILFHKKQRLSFTEQRLCYIFGVSSGFSDAH